MPHTKSRYQQDLGFNDARLFAYPFDFMISGTASVTRNAAGDWSINQGNSQTVFYGVDVLSLIQRRMGFGEDLQEQFGGAGIAGSAEYQGRPDTIAGMGTGQPITPRTAFKVKGVKILSFDVVYLIGGATLGGHTCRVDQTLFVNNVASAITAVLASGANGLATAVQTNPYVTNVALAANQQVYRTSPDQSLILEVSAVTGGSATYRLYGADILFEYNCN